jgi:hypothetical protein
MNVSKSVSHLDQIDTRRTIILCAPLLARVHGMDLYLHFGGLEG